MGVDVQSWLLRPGVDKLIATIAITPFVYDLYQLLHDPHLFSHWGMIGYLFNCALIVLTMLARRPPLKVTTNVWLWLLTPFTTYLGALAPWLANDGHSIASPVVIGCLALIGPALTVWARISLGRSIGFVPALRGVVVSGPYRYIRHPIYAGALISLSAMAIESFSLQNILFFGFGALCIVLKSLAEERFLAISPEYSHYAESVKWRWVLWVI
jgi:protein-S-isoprenylcysteine O-methyltransferase Ste14